MIRAPGNLDVPRLDLDGIGARRLSAGEENRKQNVAAGLALVAGRSVDDTERDGIWAVSGMEVYGLLVDHSGWTAEQYDEWLAETIVRLLRPARKTA